MVDTPIVPERPAGIDPPGVPKDHPLAEAIRTAGPALAAQLISRRRHPFLIAIPPTWALARSRSQITTGWEHTPYNGPLADDAVCPWRPGRSDRDWGRGMFCWANLPTALLRASYGVRLREAFVVGGLRPHLVYLTNQEAMLLAAFETGQLMPSVLPETLVVEQLTMPWDEAETSACPNPAERLAIVLCAHALRCHDDEKMEDTYGAAAAMAAICTGDVDPARVIGANNDGDLLATFGHTDMLRVVGLTQESAGDLRIPLTELPYWTGDVPAFVTKHRAAMDELTRRTRSEGKDE